MLTRHPDSSHWAFQWKLGCFWEGPSHLPPGGEYFLKPPFRGSENTVTLGFLKLHPYHKAKIPHWEVSLLNKKISNTKFCWYSKKLKLTSKSASPIKCVKTEPFSLEGAFSPQKKLLCPGGSKLRPPETDSFVTTSPTNVCKEATNICIFPKSSLLPLRTCSSNHVPRPTHCLLHSVVSPT